MPGVLGFEVAEAGRAVIRWRTAGGDRVDAMPFRCPHCWARVAGQADHAGLAGGVRARGRPGGCDAQDAGDADDRAARLHDSAARLGHPVSCRSGSGRRPAGTGRGSAGRRHRGAHAGVVDQDVDVAELGHRGVDDGLALPGSVASVCTDRALRPAASTQFGGAGELRRAGERRAPRRRRPRRIPSRTRRRTRRAPVTITLSVRENRPELSLCRLTFRCGGSGTSRVRRRGGAVSRGHQIEHRSRPGQPCT